MKNQFLADCQFFFIVCILSSSAAHAQRQSYEQESPKMQPILSSGSKKGWHHFTNQVSLDLQKPEQFFEQHRDALGLLKGYGMILLSKTEEPSRGMIHYKFQQTFNGIPIVGSEYILHHRQGRPLKGNGKIVRDFIRGEQRPAISGNAAIQAALAQVNATRYAWQSPQHETMIKNRKKDAQATLYPQPKLVYYSTSDNAEDPSSYQLAYEMKVMALEPVSHNQFYISAETGNVLGSINLIHETNAPATGTTLYNGVQNITTDFTGSNYVLRETNRGGSGTAISTYDMNSITTDPDLAVDFQNTSTTWINEPVGVQGHWSSEKTFDYFYNVHNRNSFDDNGGEIISYLDFNLNYNNAHWFGLYMVFGAGDGIFASSWATLDIVAHEFTHGVTESSADLLYLNESGALNESFSDIFGTMVEFYAEGNNGDWVHGEDVWLDDGLANRSLSNPNLYGDPDTYLGTHWFSGTADNGGVHFNSGVQNHWFYLLSEGGSGINDNGDSFSLTGIGRDAAAAIAYRNLTVYLTRTSNYMDARDGALQAAEDLYGRTSVAYSQTAMAWYAVGLGIPVHSGQDIRPRSVKIDGGSCDQLFVKVELVNFSTTTTIPAGALINILVKENGVAKPAEQFVLSSSLAPGGAITRILSQPVSSTAAKVNIEVQINYLPDPEPGNNTATALLLRGAFTIGGNSPDFPNIASATSALSHPNLSLCGHLNFKIRSGHYNELLKLENITASSSENTVTFESESGNPDDVNIYSFGAEGISSGLGTIRIENTNGVRIKNLTVTRESFASLPTTTISIRKKVNDLVLEGNKLMAIGSGVSNNNIGLRTFGETQRHITIRNNILGPPSIFSPSLGIYGVDDQSLNDQVLIENNQFFDHQAAINNLKGINVTIRGNVITASNVSSAISASASPLHIENNIFNLGGTFVTGLEILSGGFSTATIVNNMINIISSQRSAAISVSQILRAEILHNTIKQEKTTTGAAGSTSITFQSVVSGLDVRNNILFNTVISGKGISLPVEQITGVVDHNDFHIPNGHIGLKGLNYPTLSQWRTATGHDLNSIAVQPVFTGPTDLHLAIVQPGNLKKGAITNVLHDIDGELRGSPSYLGADEGVTPALTLSQTSFPTVDQCGQTIQIAVTTDNNWAVENLSGAFITVSPLSGTGNSTIRLQLSNNTTVKSRNFSFTVRNYNGTIVRQVSGYQNAGICDAEPPPPPGDTFSIYPNPVENNTLVLHGGNDQVVTYEMIIHNSNGDIKQKQKLTLSPGQVETKVSVSNLPSGIYLLRLTDSAGKIKTFRFEKK